MSAPRKRASALYLSGERIWSDEAVEDPRLLHLCATRCKSARPGRSPTSCAAAIADVPVDNGEMVWRCGDPFYNRLHFYGEASGDLLIPATVPITCFDQFNSRSGSKTTDNTSAPLSEFGSKLVPRNAVFPVLIGDPPVELGSLGLRHRQVLVVEALPEGFDQIEPLARRKPS
jgi:hypothetical protein